ADAGRRARPARRSAPARPAGAPRRWRRHPRSGRRSTGTLPCRTAPRDRRPSPCRGPTRRRTRHARALPRRARAPSGPTAPSRTARTAPPQVSTAALISTLGRVNGPLSVATIVAALALALWCLARAGLNRAPSRVDLTATLVLSALVAVLVAVAVAGLFDGSRPREIGTFIGYLITTIAFAP